MNMQENLGDLVKNLNKNMPVCDAKCQASGKREKLMNEYNKAKYNQYNAALDKCQTPVRGQIPLYPFCLSALSGQIVPQPISGCADHVFNKMVVSNP